MPSPRPSSFPLPRFWLAGLAAICALAYLWLFNYSEPINNPNENVRVYMVRAIAEHHTYEIARRSAQGDHGPIYDQWGYVNDKALVCDVPTKKPPDCTGRLYAAKAPGMGFVGVLPHLAHLKFRAYMHWPPPSKAATLWWLRFSCVIVPTLIALLWLARHLSTRLDRPRIGLAVTLAAALGSLSLSYGQMFAGHQASGLALLLCFAAVLRADKAGHPWAVAVAGFGAAAAACIEFPAGPPGAILLGWLLLRRRDSKDLLWISLGAALPAGLLAHFDTVAFGAPWHLPYSHLENPGFVQDIAPGIFGISVPNKEKTLGSLISPYTGLYFFAPWMALAWLGFVGSRPGRAPLGTTSFWLDRRADALMASLICLYFLYFQCSHSLWRGGWVVGPRYITAMVPFAALAVAHGIDALPALPRRAASWLLAISAMVAIVVTGLSAAVSQGFPIGVHNPLNEVIGPLLRLGWVARNPLMELHVPGVWSALPYFAALLAGGMWIGVLLATEAPQTGPRRWLGPGVLVVLAAVAVALLWRIQGPRPQSVRDECVQFLTSTWTPAHPPGARPLPPPGR